MYFMVFSNIAKIDCCFVNFGIVFLGHTVLLFALTLRNLNVVMYARHLEGLSVQTSSVPTFIWLSKQGWCQNTEIGGRRVGRVGVSGHVQQHLGMERASSNLTCRFKRRRIQLLCRERQKEKSETFIFWQMSRNSSFFVTISSSLQDSVWVSVFQPFLDIFCWRHPYIMILMVWDPQTPNYKEVCLWTWSIDKQIHYMAATLEPIQGTLTRCSTPVGNHWSL